MSFSRGVQLRLPLLHHRFRSAHFALALVEQGFRGGNRALCFLDLRGGLQPLFVEHAGIHAGQDVALANKLPLLDQDRLDTSGGFGGDIDFRGFNSTVAAGKARWNPRRAQHPPCRRGNHHR